MSVTVDHNYPHRNDLKIVDHAGAPLENVEIRIFALEKFLACDTNVPVAQTTTNHKGEWTDSIELPDGRSWVVHFQKLGVVGPAHREIIT